MTRTQQNLQNLYKESVFLPKTDFAMRANLPETEPETLRFWEKIDLYRLQRAHSAGRQKWVLHWGPPYANGDIHIGHVLSETLKDVAVRCKQMEGFDAPLVPGWDCHGLPIEWKVEQTYRAKGKDKNEVGTAAFRNECRAFAQTWIDRQSQDLQRLGLLADFRNPYSTMDQSSEGTIVGEIHKLARNGLLYRGVKPVMWSIVEQTALAEAEVEYHEHESSTIYVAFPVVSPKQTWLSRTEFLIWTTTPWTIPANCGIAFSPDVSYGLYAFGQRKLVLAQKLAAAVSADLGADLEFICQVEASDIVGTFCSHPLLSLGFNVRVPLLAGNFVQDDAGTGLVHLAPAHGEDDFKVCVANGIVVPDDITDDGRYRPHVPRFAGMAVYTESGEKGPAEEAIIAALESEGYLVARKQVRHEYPHSWRSKAPLIYRATPQWFVGLDKTMADGRTLRHSALQAISSTAWYPAQGEGRIGAMVSERRDWCLSRQRVWGTPIALFVDRRTKEILLDDAVLERIRSTIAMEGANAWWTKAPEFFLGEAYSVDDYEQVFDTADVWFDSASTHRFVCAERPDLKWPADLYFEGSDQHRGFFQSSLLQSCATRGRAPYDSVVTHGFVLDERGYKMSKSLGNVVDPKDVLRDYGADILRLWATSADYTHDIRMGGDSLKTASETYRRFRNTLRFLLGALHDFSGSEMLTAADHHLMPELDRLVLHRLHALDRACHQEVAQHAYNRMTNHLAQFCSTTLSSLYFDIRKDILYCDQATSLRRRSVRTVLHHVLEVLLTRLAPVLPFTTEEAWRHRPRTMMPGLVSVHLTRSPDLPLHWVAPDLSRKWDRIAEIRQVVLALMEHKRNEKRMGSPLEAAPHIYLSPAYMDAAMGVDLAEVCITSQARVSAIADLDRDAFSIADIPGVAVVFGLAEGQKCQRSRRILPEVGMDEEFPDLSTRDAEAFRKFMSRRTLCNAAPAA